MRRAYAAGLVSLVLVAVLTGCSNASSKTSAADVVHHHAPHTIEPVESTATATPAHEVVATGTLSSANGVTEGTISIVTDAHAQRVFLAGFHTDLSALTELSLSPWAPTVPCLTDQHAIATTIGAAMGPDGGQVGFARDDLSYLRTAVIATHTDGVDANGCVLTPVATAALHWDIPSRYPHLTAVDHGSQIDAAGTVTTVNGSVTAYTVAADDNLNTIAHRFGLTLAQLRYLNPWSFPPIEPGQVLDLTQAGRGTIGISPPPHS